MDPETVGFLIGLLVPLAVLVLALVLGTRVVAQHERLVIFRLGRTGPALVRDPGIRFVIPFIDRTVRVDMRQQDVEVPRQVAVTRDEATVQVEYLVSYRVSDALASVINVADVPAALRAIATPAMREALAETTLDDVRFGQRALEERVLQTIEEQARTWGCSVTGVAIKELTPVTVGKVSAAGPERSGGSRSSAS